MINTCRCVFVYMPTKENCLAFSLVNLIQPKSLSELHHE